MNRDFTATAPNQLWVMDLTYVATWAQMAYVWFITDAFSRHIVGWRVASHMRTAMVLDALEMARWARGTRLEGLVTATGTTRRTRCCPVDRRPDQGPWPTIDDVELATLGWVHWYNTERLHGYLDDVPPDEYEEAHYAQTATTR